MCFVETAVLDMELEDEGRAEGRPVLLLDDEFDATAPPLHESGLGAITLNAYRSRLPPGEPRDPLHDSLARRLADVEQIATPTLMIQGANDRCDRPGGQPTGAVLHGGYLPPASAPARNGADSPGVVLSRPRRSS